MSVSPISLTPSNAGDATLSDAVFGRELALSLTDAGADACDFRGCELRMGVVCAARVPTLLHHISHVVLAGPQEQMLRVHAGSDITMVQDGHSTGDRTVVQNPRGSVSPNWNASYAERAIAHGG